MTKDSREVHLRLPGKHGTELFELIRQGDVLHLHRHLLRRRQPIEHLLKGRGQRLEAHLDARLRDHLGFQQAGKRKSPAGVPAHQRLGELLETLVLLEASFDRVLPGLQLFLLANRHLRHQAGGLELDQTGADHQKRGQPFQGRPVLSDGFEIVVGEGGERNRLQVDFSPLGQRQQQLDRPVEGRRPDDVDGIALEFRGDLPTQFRVSARCSRRVTSDTGCAA